MTGAPHSNTILAASGSLCEETLVSTRRSTTDIEASDTTRMYLAGKIEMDMLTGASRLPCSRIWSQIATISPGLQQGILGQHLPAILSVASYECHRIQESLIPTEQAFTCMLNSATEPVLPVPRQPPINTISILGRISGNNETSRAAFVSAPVQTSAMGCSLCTQPCIMTATTATGSGPRSPCITS